jgi:hypothetical protein
LNTYDINQNTEQINDNFIDLQTQITDLSATVDVIIGEIGGSISLLNTSGINIVVPDDPTFNEGNAININGINNNLLTIDQNCNITTTGVVAINNTNPDNAYLLAVGDIDGENNLFYINNKGATNILANVDDTDTIFTTENNNNNKSFVIDGACNVITSGDISANNFTGNNISGNIISGSHLFLNGVEFTGSGISLTDLSVINTSGYGGSYGNLAYNNTNGVFTYTGVTTGEIRSTLSAGSGISYDISSGIISATGGGGGGISISGDINSDNALFINKVGDTDNIYATAGIQYDPINNILTVSGDISANNISGVTLNISSLSVDNAGNLITSGDISANNFTGNNISGVTLNISSLSVDNAGNLITSGDISANNICGISLNITNTSGILININGSGSNLTVDNSCNLTTTGYINTNISITAPTGNIDNLYSINNNGSVCTNSDTYSCSITAGEVSASTVNSGNVNITGISGGTTPLLSMSGVPTNSSPFISISGNNGGAFTVDSSCNVTVLQPSLFILPVFNSLPNDNIPTGAMAINSSDNTINVYLNGVWKTITTS